MIYVDRCYEAYFHNKPRRNFSVRYKRAMQSESGYVRHILLDLLLLVPVVLEEAQPATRDISDFSCLVYKLYVFGYCFTGNWKASLGYRFYCVSGSCDTKQVLCMIVSDKRRCVPGWMFYDHGSIRYQLPSTQETS
jgi:hypothetical protein